MALKLRSKGFDKEISAQAAKYLSAIGYINEGEDAVREAERCLKKYWGIKRIVAFLYEKGYSESAVRLAVAELDGYDMSEACIALVERKLGGLPDDREAQKKLFASLLRYGHSSSDIKKAFDQYLDTL